MVHLAEFAPSLRTLGSYPRWREPGEAAEATGATPVGSATAPVKLTDSVKVTDSVTAADSVKQGAARG